MIKTFRLFNFKPFQDTQNIELKPITVLAGPNSGGKTSIFQSLLLLKQTLESEEYDIHLNLNGRFLQFFRFNELTFGKPSLPRCNVGYEFDLETKIPSKLAHEFFPDIDIPKGSNWLPLQSNIEFYFRYKETKGGKKKVIMDKFAMRCKIKESLGPELKMRFYNKKYQVKIKGKGTLLPKTSKDQNIIDWLGRHFLPTLLVIKPKKGKAEVRPQFIELRNIFLNPIMRLGLELEHLKYLGPLREEPRRAYLHTGSPFYEIGLRGEYAAQLLWLERNEMVPYFANKKAKQKKVTLLEAVKDSFLQLGLLQPLDIKSTKSIVYQILFGIKSRKEKKQVTITDVGFGVSQLLPILVMSLRSPKKSLLLFEQPEIHLHPKLQANLADFFINISLSGRRLLIETHSDHLINRLRRRIAEDKTSELKDKISILFIRPPHGLEGALIDPLKVNQFGVIENWPPDFLPESADEAEAIFRAGLEKRAK